MKVKISTLLLLLTLFCCSCSQNKSDSGEGIVSMQIIDRNGFVETISSKDRLEGYQGTDFLSSQPYQKVLRVFERSSQGQTQSKITSYHPNGQIWQFLEVVDGRAHGVYREWFPNSQLRIECQVIEGLADINDLSQTSWVFDGKSSVWNEEGQLIAEIHYDKGALTTPSLYFHSNGKIFKSLSYEQGELHGSVLVYDDEGNLSEKECYDLGQKHGICTAFWRPEQLLYQEEYDHGLLQNARYYDSKGKLIAEIKKGEGKQAQFKDGFLYTTTEFKKGVPHGKVEEFRADGSLFCAFTIQNGKKNGEEWEYYLSANKKETKPKICLHWHDDAIQGQVKTWYENGKLESQREINHNKKQGLSLAWYKNGDLMLAEEYENDLLVKGSYFKKGDKKPTSKIEDGKGTATIHTNEGIFLKKIAYEKGKPLLQDEVLR